MRTAKIIEIKVEHYMRTGLYTREQALALIASDKAYESYDHEERNARRDRIAKMDFRHQLDELDMDAQALRRQREREAFDTLRELEDTGPRTRSVESDRYSDPKKAVRPPAVIPPVQPEAKPAPVRTFTPPPRKSARPVAKKGFTWSSTLPKHLRVPECAERRR